MRLSGIRNSRRAAGSPPNFTRRPPARVYFARSSAAMPALGIRNGNETRCANHVATTSGELECTSSGPPSPDPRCSATAASTKLLARDSLWSWEMNKTLLTATKNIAAANRVEQQIFFAPQNPRSPDCWDHPCSSKSFRAGPVAPRLEGARLSLSPKMLLLLQVLPDNWRNP